MNLIQYFAVALVPNGTVRICTPSDGSTVGTSFNVVGDYTGTWPEVTCLLEWAGSGPPPPGIPMSLGAWNDPTTHMWYADFVPPLPPVPPGDYTLSAMIPNVPPPPPTISAHTVHIHVSSEGGDGGWACGGITGPLAEAEVAMRSLWTDRKPQPDPVSGLHVRVFTSEAQLNGFKVAGTFVPPTTAIVEATLGPHQGVIDNGPTDWSATFNNVDPGDYALNVRGDDGTPDSVGVRVGHIP